MKKQQGLETQQNNGQHREGNIITLSGMYENYFLDYASYVILERAVPGVEDGLKPVQRRILHAMFEMNDGRFHKVANIIGQTMQYHPHGDAAIGEALVNLGQKNLLFDCQGNWGDTRTGDGAAAARYIEARLSKFALEVAFNKKVTQWQNSYDGRKQEPIALPMKFPLVLAQGVEGIAVGLATKILPHNFVELLKASIAYLRNKPFKLYPDFETGGMADISDYQGGKRGGKVLVRAKMEELDKKTLIIKEIPFGITTPNLIESIIKANEKGKIKIKKVTDNTAENVEILVELAPGASPSVTIDALYAFTHCQMSISPNACIIIQDKPHFLTVEEILKICTDHTLSLLEWELKIQQQEWEEKWHFASLEKIFIEKRIYRKIEECETWEAVLEAIQKGLTPYAKRFKRPITEDDMTRLTEIRIKRISKYNTFKADEYIRALEEELVQIAHRLEHITDFTIQYYQNLLEKYGAGRERRTILKAFDVIEATEVIANNCKLYVNADEGFVGYGLKKDTFVCDCSDIDDLIIFRKDGKYLVTKIAEKSFVGKDILHVAVWRKGDQRTTYHAAYLDGESGRAFVKRFQVNAVTRDREYDILSAHAQSKLLYFAAHLNGEAETIRVHLTQGCAAKVKMFDYDFGELAIKGRTTKGNLLTTYPVRKIAQQAVGASTLGAQPVWLDDASGKLNTDARGDLIGAFDTGDRLLAVYTDGTYQLHELDLAGLRFEAEKLMLLMKFDPHAVLNVLYYEGERKATFVKRFQVENIALGQRHLLIGEHGGSKLYLATADTNPEVEYTFKLKQQILQGRKNLEHFADVKGWKAIGTKLADGTLRTVQLVSSDLMEVAAAEPTAPTATDADDQMTLLFE